ncbi:hypothetical protein ABQE58_24575 [Mycolicibacterium elephantis]|uniref:hypothetical protein n=1 Tax=Mycolicibacterium elephantis TaxID=81858 RepID=UPI0007EB2262|nr:hypothetical protein [Mycolicibacterium elephantis]OBB28950.1 hypothetical protein A5762_00050 [Mycolicibacterium elephantis]
MEPDGLLPAAAELVDALTVTAVEFQERFQAKDDSAEERERRLTQLSKKWDPEPYNVMIRRFEMAGFDEAAAKFKDLVVAVHRIVTALDPGKYWELSDALEDLNVDVGPLRQSVLDVLAQGGGETIAMRERDAISPPKWERIQHVTDAAVLADKIYFLSLEYESYRDGFLPLFTDDDEDGSAEEGMRRVTAEYARLKTAPIIEWLRSQGLSGAAAANALDDLSRAASEVLHLGDSGDVDEQCVETLTALWEKAIDAIRSAR